MVGLSVIFVVIIPKKNWKEKIKKVQKLNEDLIEAQLANRNRLKSQENKIKVLKTGINKSAADIEQFKKDLDANT